MTTFKTLFTTFYSYKGGVGRTSALVNTALLRAISGDRVVVMDFDFEAPGVSAYVKELAIKDKKSIDLDAYPGILDYLYDATENRQISELRKNTISGVDLGLKMDGEIWFIGAGNITDKKYPRRLSAFNNWAEIFEEKEGALLLENFKQQIMSEFDGPDYVFIDSTTGITESGSVCTRYLSDLVVVLSSLNEQNIMGTSRVFHAFKESNISTILVASNVPVGLPWGTDQLFSSRIDNFKDKFCSSPDLLIYHYPSLSLMEYLPSYFKLKDDESFLKKDPLLKSYEALSDEIESKNEYSFDKFLNEMIFTKLMFHRGKKEKELEEDFSFFSKYYGNRNNILEIAKVIHELNKDISKTDSEKVTDDFIAKTKQLKNSNLSRRYGNLFMMKKMILRNASERIINFYSRHKDKLRSPYEWYGLLEDMDKLEAIILLLSIPDYQFVYDTISDKEERYFILAKAYAGEKINKSDHLKHYEFFLKSADEGKMSSPGAFFACAYAAFKLNQMTESKNFLLKSREAAEKGDEHLPFFIPTKFEKVKSKQEFLKALSDFEVDCHY